MASSTDPNKGERPSNASVKRDAALVSAALGLAVPPCDRFAMIDRMSNRVVRAVLVLAAATAVALIAWWMAGRVERATPRASTNETTPPMPLSDATPPAATEAPENPKDKEYVVHVVREDRGSAEGARVVVLGPDYHEEGTADARGLCRLKGVPAKGHVFVVVPGMPLVAARVAAQDDGLLVLAPAGGAVTGRVVVSEGRLPTHVVLEFPWSEDDTDLPLEAWQSLMGAFMLFPMIVTAPVRADGTFQLAGLPPGEAWWDAKNFRPLGLYAIAEEDAGVMIPSGDVMVRLSVVPHIEGRVVRADGAPVEGASAVLNGLEMRTDVDGFFCDALRGMTGPFSLTIADERGRGSRTIELGKPGPQGFVLGDLALRTAAPATLVVLDDKGKPIKGAVAQSLAPGAPVSSPADEAGRIPIACSGERYRVGAWARETLVVDVPEAPKDPFEVRLVPATVLRIRVIGEAPGAEVVVRSDARVLPEHLWEAVDFFRGTGITIPRSSLGPGETYWTFEPSPAINLCDIRPGATLHVDLLDSLGIPHETQAITLRPAEELDLTLTPRLPVRRVQGVVRDDKGAPVPHAWVAIREDHHLAAMPTDESGRFAFLGVSVSAVQLSADAEGFAPLVRAEPDLPRSGEDIEVTLAKGRVVDVTVIDESGTPIKATVFADLGSDLGMRPGECVRVARMTDNDISEIAGLPDVDLDVTIDTHGTRKTVRVKATETEIRVVLPRG